MPRPHKQKGQKKMSRSYRKYKGLSHTQSDTKQGKSIKRIYHKQVRARAKSGEDGLTAAQRCHPSNCYDGACFTAQVYRDIATRRSEGYSEKRVEHKLMGK